MKFGKTTTVLLIAIGLLFVGMMFTRHYEAFESGSDKAIEACSKDSDCDFNARCTNKKCIARIPVTLVVPKKN